MEAAGSAAAIVTFVDFSWKLISEAREIYYSASGSTDNNLTFETVANELIRLSSSISTSRSHGGELNTLCKECDVVAKDLLNAIGKLKVKGKHKRWESFASALKSIWGKRELDGLLQRLQKLQVQLSLSLQSIMV